MAGPAPSGAADVDRSQLVRTESGRCLSEEERDIAEAFTTIDANCDGVLSRSEVIKACRSSERVRLLLGLPRVIRQEDGTRDAFETVFQRLDADDSKSVTLDEFLGVFGHSHSSAGSGTQALQYSLHALCDATIEPGSALRASSAPSHRTGHTATRLGDEVLIFGGMLDGECTAELLALHVPTLHWQPVLAEGECPSSRLGHAACALEADGQLWLFGGGDGRVLLSDVWLLDRVSERRVAEGGGGAQEGATRWSWRRQLCAGPPPASRMGHCLVHLPSQRCLLSFGGFVKGVKGGYSSQVRGSKARTRDAEALMKL